MANLPLSPRLVRIIALLSLILYGSAATAQTADSDSIIISPEAPRSPGYSGGFGDIASEAGKSLKTDLDSLQQNLAILHDLNSVENQRAIDSLGTNYANIKDLGSTLGDAISGIDTAALATNSEALAKNVQATMDAYGPASTALTDKLKDAVKNSGFSAQNPPSQSDSQGLSEQAKKMAKDQAEQALPVLGIDYTGVIKLDNNISTLNTNVVSMTKTYLNLIKLTNESPSVLTGMPDLSTELATVNGLASDDIKPLAGLNDSMASINTAYAQLNEHKVQVKDGVGNINGTIEDFTKNLAKTNDDMALSLGSPTPAPAAGQNGSGSTTTDTK